MSRAALFRLLAFLRPFAGWVLLAVLLGAVTTASSAALLGTSAYLIAYAALQPSIAVLQVAIVGVRFFGISRAVLRYLERLVSHAVNFRHLAQLRVWLYERIEPLAPARLIYARSSDLLSRIVADIDTLENFYVRAAAPPLSALVVVVGVVAFTTRYDLGAALVLLAGLLVVGIALPVFIHALGRRPGATVIEQRAGLHHALLDGVQGMADLLAYHRDGAQIEAVDALGQRLTRAQELSGRVGALGSALAVLGAGITLCGVLLVAVPLVGRRLDGISLAVLALLATAAFEAVSPLVAAAQHLESSLRAGGRLFALADAEPEIFAPTHPLPAPVSADIRVRGLTFTYPGESAPALVDVDLDLPPGKRVAIVGPSGAGKTTLLHLLLRFWDVPPGAVLWNGSDIRAYNPEDLRCQVALVSQNGYLFAGTLRQNLLLARPQANERELEQAVEQAQLGELITQLPDGLNTWVGEHGLKLSGGERQRLLMARALLRASPLLLLDEPTAGLDRTTERQLLNALLNASSGRSLIAVTHRLVSMENMDEILVLHLGKVMERGTHAALMAQGGRYARMWAIEQAAFEGPIG